MPIWFFRKQKSSTSHCHQLQKFILASVKLPHDWKKLLFSKVFWGVRHPSYTPNFQPGLPYSFYHGRTGIIFNVNRNALGESLGSDSKVHLRQCGSTLKERHPLAIWNWLQKWKHMDLWIIFCWSGEVKVTWRYIRSQCIFCRKLPLFQEFPSPDWWKMWKVAVID